MRYALIIWLFFEICEEFSLLLFQKQASNDQLTKGNVLKTMLIKDKQSNFEKEMYGFFYTPNIFHLGQVNEKLTLNKIDFYFLKLTEMYFILFS